MPNYNCVEPANDNGADQHALIVTATDSITFPAVDSCFAIAYVMTDGRLVGAAEAFVRLNRERVYKRAV